MKHKPDPHPREILFDDVAAQLEAMEQPMSAEWMAQRHVSIDELHALSQKFALILRAYRSLKPQDRIAFVSSGVFSRAPIEETGA